MRPISRMRQPSGFIPVMLALGLFLSVATTLLAQVQGPAPKPAADVAPPVPLTDRAGTTTQTPPDTVSLPVDVDHIRQQVEKQPAVKLDEHQLRFYVLVLAKQPKIDDFIGDYDLKNGPTKGGAAMTHQEFLNMVTPKELNQLFGATSGSSFAMFQAAVMNATAQSLIKKAIQEIRAAHDEREVQAIRERIDRELAALLGKD